jgi:thiamine-phosphate pyrophosphorylase
MNSYAITDKINFSFDTIFEDLTRISKVANFILYRDKTNPSYTTNAIKFSQEAKKFDFEKIFIQNDIDLAMKLGVSIHFSSANISKIAQAKSKNLFVIASTHNENEILLANSLGVDMITLSPLFTSPNKGKPLGAEEFRRLQKLSNAPVIALGGIVTKKHIDFVKSLGAVGFASIRYFAR